MAVKELLEAMDGPPGSLDAYLECHSDAEIKVDIMAQRGHPETPTKRELLAAMAMQGLLSNPTLQNIDRTVSSEQAVSRASRCFADALIAELAAGGKHE